MLVSKNFKQVDRNGKTFEIHFGADAKNVTVNGEKLTNVIDDIKVSAHTHGNKNVLDQITADEMLRWSDAAYQSESFFSSTEYVSIKEIADDIESVRDSSVQTQRLQNVDIKTITATGIYDVDVPTCSELPDDVTSAACGATLIVSRGAVQNDIFYVNQYLIVNDFSDSATARSIMTKIYACQLYGNNYDYPWRLVASSDSANQTKYSTTPVKIGEWIDGTPVWRVAIPITEVEKIGCTNVLNAWSVRVDEILDRLNVVEDTSYVIYLEDSLVFQNSNDYSLEAFSSNMSKYAAVCYRFAAADGDPTTHFYGWIEFATPESNIVRNN
ncbi:MAG: hypothetical protein Q4G33_15385 [bacterium]|nr:hypothetical protein [bacterium]